MRVTMEMSRKGPGLTGSSAVAVQDRDHTCRGISKAPVIFSVIEKMEQLIDDLIYSRIHT